MEVNKNACLAMSYMNQIPGERSQDLLKAWNEAWAEVERTVLCEPPPLQEFLFEALMIWTDALRPMCTQIGVAKGAMWANQTLKPLQRKVVRDIQEALHAHYPPQQATMFPLFIKGVVFYATWLVLNDPSPDGDQTMASLDDALRHFEPLFQGNP
jgi:hypothetical protein